MVSDLDRVLERIEESALAGNRGVDAGEELAFEFIFEDLLQRLHRLRLGVPEERHEHAAVDCEFRHPVLVAVLLELAFDKTVPLDQLADDEPLKLLLVKILGHDYSESLE